MLSLIEALPDDTQAIFKEHRDHKKCTPSRNKRRADSPAPVPRKRRKSLTSSPCIDSEDMQMVKPDHRHSPFQVDDNDITSTLFLHIPSEKELRDCQVAFLEAISPAAVQEVVCAVCAQLRWECKCAVVDVSDIPNAHCLRPADQDSHPAQVLTDGMLLETNGIIEVNEKWHVNLCGTCLQNFNEIKSPGFPYQIKCGSAIYLLNSLVSRCQNSFYYRQFIHGALFSKCSPKVYVGMILLVYNLAYGGM
jgi:hypothetical protein